MSDHPNVVTVNRMTQAIVEQDKDTLGEIFTGDFVFHLRGAYELAGDHAGVAGLLEVLGSIFEATNGDIRLEQLYCIADGDWASEWERATLGRNGATLESYNSFVYRFETGRIAEMWMFLGADAARAAAFFA